MLVYHSFAQAYNYYIDTLHFGTTSIITLDTATALLRAPHMMDRTPRNPLANSAVRHLTPVGHHAL